MEKKREDTGAEILPEKVLRWKLQIVVALTEVEQSGLHLHS